MHFCEENINKIVRPVLAALNANGLSGGFAKELHLRHLICPILASVRQKKNDYNLNSYSLILICALLAVSAKS